ncbi:MAG TPA: protein phosphatase 2C domain-containing protein [Hymenobacter sp.]|nr:protein phosphatase 2C domain-containing protein [Hymenobacter sp.]
MTPLRIAGKTDVGQQRQDNQDAFVTLPLWSEHDVLLVVIDGVGGYAGGAEAAALAKEAIVQYMAAPTGDTLTMLREAVVHANNQIVRQRQQDPALARMCCVLTAAVADPDAGRLLFVHVGDTRLYRFRHQQLEKLTRDHSMVGLREDANQLTEREAMSHPRRNEILRDIGSTAHRVDDPDFLESGETDFLPGDGLLLCSDGLTDMLTRAEVTDVLTQPLSVVEQVDELIRQANEQGGHDNITVVLAQYPVPSGDVEVTSNVTPKPTQLPLAGITQPMPASIPVAGSVSTPAPARKRTGKLILLLFAMLLAGVVWWQYVTPAPAKPNATEPSGADSSARPDTTNQSDSVRTP